MTEQEYLIEKGNERKYVGQAELAALTEEGWIVLGHRTMRIGAEVSQTRMPPKAPKPNDKKNKEDDKAGG